MSDTHSEINSQPAVAVVIPAFKVRNSILSVIAQPGKVVSRIYVVDDGCPEKTGAYVSQSCTDPRLTVLFHERNQGVGAAVKTGYRAALRDGFDIIVKLDGDDQMPGCQIKHLLQPLVEGKADYTKGNRFYSYELLRSMPKNRLFGNAVISFLNKAATGYWNIMDPTNGFTAIRSEALQAIPLDKVADDYFFECDMLFRLNTIRAVVTDIPMEAIYRHESSNLIVSQTIRTFPVHLFRSLFKRIYYSYFLRDFNIASIQLPAGALLLLGGLSFGSYHWWQSVQTGVASSSGTVMLSALPVIIGCQLILAAISFDMQNIPKSPVLFAIIRRPRSESDCRDGE